MEYKRPHTDEFEQMVTLQNKNLVSVLAASDKNDGFLSASFTAEQFQAMNNDLCVVICKDNSQVCGYLCATSPEFNKAIPLVNTMLEQFPYITYQNKPLSAYRHAISGPVCIDKSTEVKTYYLIFITQ